MILPYGSHCIDMTPSPEPINGATGTWLSCFAWFDGELYKFHRWFHSIYILIMQLRSASFILGMKSRVLLCSKVGMIMVSICLHGVISWSQASGRGRFGPTKTVIAEKNHPSVFKFCLTWTVYNISNKMTKFYDDVYSFEPVRGCQFLKLY